MQKTAIEWTDYTWNPIKGICPVGCWYCYARAMYKRFKWDEKVRIDEDEIYGDVFPKKPSRIFVCSTFELFHPSVHELIRDAIFARIGFNSQHTVQILTKLPQNIDREMPDNVWLGVSITNPLAEHERVWDLLHHSARIEFVSLEPLIGEYFHSIIPIELLDWVIVGRMTGHGHKYDPKIDSIKRIVSDCKRAKTPIFLKNNLIPIVGQKLVSQYQEMPG